MKEMKKSRIIRMFSVVLLAFILTFSVFACSNELLDPKRPVRITLWHYYTGGIATAFENMVKEFNEGEGAKKGVIVNSLSKSSVTALKKAVLSSAKGEVKADPMPDIFAAYADTAYEIEKMGLLADIGQYLTAAEQETYVDIFIEEGKIGLNGELRIFPIAKSTEVLMLNDTDWAEFAQEYGYTYDDLSTYESIASVAKNYYEWTDAQTPDVPNNGRAFFGRDSMANHFIISSMEFEQEIFEVENGKGTINIDRDVMKKLWDYYYVPYISGYFFASGSFRSEDAKEGRILSYVGSTASANYAPKDVTINNSTHSITPKMLPVPSFEGGQRVQVQQGAGMVVSKTTKAKEYASVLFLKWFTESYNNTEFCVGNGYMPVKKSASNYENMMNVAKENQISVSPIMDATLEVTFSFLQHGSLYTNKAFEGGADARDLLDTHLQSLANKDRELVQLNLKFGISLEEAVSEFNTEEHFLEWVDSLEKALKALT